MQVKCEYCGSMIDDKLESCPNCGAPNTNMVRTADQTPRTIEQLKKWYMDRHLPPQEITRFFIGMNYHGARAFGIYEENGRFIVYKNKEDGSRAIRYEGTDEAYAVNEIYLKLKSEILNQKARNGANRSASYRSGRSYHRKSASEQVAEVVWPTLKKLGIVAIGTAVMLLIAGPPEKPAYYKYNDTVYCSYDDNYYVYDDTDADYSHINYTSLPEELQLNPDEYYFDTDGGEWDSSYSFMDSDYYDTYIRSEEEDDYDYSSSDRDYDWDSDSDWDSGDSDWGSDW